MYHGPRGVPWPWGVPWPSRGVPWPSRGVPWPSRGVPWPSRGVPWPLYEDHAVEPNNISYCRTTLSGHIFATKACIDNRKKLVKQQYLLHKPHNMVNFGPLTAEIDWRVWGTLSYFNGYRVLAALLHGSQVVGVSQTLGVEQRAPPMIGKAAITLGIDKHSSFSFFFLSYSVFIQRTILSLASASF